MPEVGKVTEVFPVKVKPNVKLPVKVIVLFVPFAIPVPPFATGNIPLTPAVKEIGGPSPLPPLWSCPTTASAKLASALYSLLKSLACIVLPVTICPADCLTYPSAI